MALARAPPAATWRGRLAEDPDAEPYADGTARKMCLRPNAMRAVQDHQCDAEYHMCKQGRGKNVIECPLHAARFSVVTGKCLAVPGEADLATYDLKVEDGEILVKLSG